MKVLGLDFGNQSDSFAMIETEIIGSFNAPHPHDIVYKFKNLSWNKKHE